MRWVGPKWYDVEVLEVLEDGRVKIRWIGFGSSWDEARSRDKLFQPAETKQKSKAEPDSKSP